MVSPRLSVVNTILQHIRRGKVVSTHSIKEAEAEVPSPVPDKLKPRIRETAMVLWKVYGLFALSTVLPAAPGVDFTTAFAALAACIGNIGPGFGAVGHADNYALLPFPGSSRKSAAHLALGPDRKPGQRIGSAFKFKGI